MTAAVSMARKSERIVSLDGLRGVAALVVLIHHSLLLVPGLSLANAREVPELGPLWWVLTYTPLRFFWAGGEAVMVFFILSGLVLALPVLRLGKSFNWKAYYPSRLIRLYVPVFFSVVLAAVLFMLVPRRSGGSVSYWLGVHDEPMSATSAAKDAVLLLGTTMLNSPLWSLMYEVLFSLLLPLYVVLAAKLRRFWLVLVVWALTTIAAGIQLGNGYLAYLPVFSLGVVMAMKMEDLELLARKISMGRNAATVWVAVLVAAIGGLCSSWYLTAVGLPREISDQAMPLVLLSAAALIFLVAFWKQAQRVFESSVMVWLGSISFSLYLVHEPVLVTLGMIFSDSPWVAVAIGIPSSLAAGWGFYCIIEKASHRLAKKVAKRQSMKAATAPVSVNAQ